MLSLQESCALFAAADLALVTSLRDGMNLTPHEFVLCQQEKMSPIILSEFTGTIMMFYMISYDILIGSAQCLSGAILVNPWDERKVAKAIHAGLTMSADHKKIMYQHNFDYVISHTATSWITLLLQELEKDPAPTINNTVVQKLNPGLLLDAYKRVLLYYIG
jgi:trehalose-6-phosphate synthase